MLKTNQGIEVTTRINGHESSMPLPKILGIGNHQKYVLTKKQNGTLIAKPKKQHHNIFDNPAWNHKNFVHFMNEAHLSKDQGYPTGKEL